MLIFSLSPILIGYRRFFQGILISYGKSKVVTISSISRLIAIIITSFIASKFFSEGALIASIGNVGGITIDALITRIACHKVLRLIPNNTTEEQNNKCPSVLLFYLPLGISTTIIYISFPAINFFASFGAFPLESIATFGSIYCVTFLLKSFGMSFQEIVISQWNKDAKTNADLRKTMFFVTSFSFVITLIFCFSDLLKIYYSKISGLSAELVEFSAVPTQILFLIPALTVFICYLKGVFIQEKKTNIIFVSSIIEIVSLILLLIIGISFKSYSAVEKSTVAVVLSNLIVLGYLIFKNRQNKSI